MVLKINKYKSCLAGQPVQNACTKFSNKSNIFSYLQIYRLRATLMTPLFQLWGCGMRGWQMQMWCLRAVLPAAVSWVLAATLTSPKQTSATTTGIWHMGHSPSRTWAIAELLVPFSLGQRLPPSHCFYMDFFFFNSDFFFFFLPLPLLFHLHLERKNAGSCMLHFSLCIRKSSFFFFFPYRYLEECMISICCWKGECFLFLFPVLLKLILLC